MIVVRAPRRAYRRAHRGQALVFLALATLILMGAMGLALDGGYNYAQRRQMQNAADAAALAGARMVARNDGTPGKNYPVLTTVQAVAQQNGADSNNVVCHYIDDDKNPFASCGDGPIPTNASNNNAPATGVQVSVSETHQTFVMRALDIPTSGTSATATARVEILSTPLAGPFTVCGIDTALDSSSTPYSGGIFKQNGWYPFPTRPGGYAECGGPGGGSPCGRTLESTDPSPTVPGPVDSTSRAVYNDYDIGTPGGNPTNDPSTIFYYDVSIASPIDYKNGSGQTQYGPTWLVHGPSGVTPCNINSSSYKGINGSAADVALSQATYSPPIVYNTSTGNMDYGTPIPLTSGNVASVNATVNGTNGCVTGQVIDNCVLILPVIDNSGSGGTSGILVGARYYMAFYMQQINGGNAHTGRLIKNYVYFGPGTTGWRPGPTSVVAIHLID
jgi:Flp pilus assembly protein TadG